MKLLPGLFLLSATLTAQLSAQRTSTHTPVQADSHTSVIGVWHGAGTVHGQQVPLSLAISGTRGNLKAALLNGPEAAQASSVTVHGNHLVVAFNYYARTLDAVVSGDTLQGTFGSSAVTYPVSLSSQALKASSSSSVSSAPDIHGDWEIQVKSVKGESAWQLAVTPAAGDPSGSSAVTAVIQRIDGDTGSLFGHWTGKAYSVSHFTPAGPALYSLTPQPDGTLLVSNLLRADQTPTPDQQNLIARRPSEARRQHLAAPTASAEQTTVQDPSIPFAFRFPDLTGKFVANTDRQFDGKVVIVAVGGSWCPNCHDEAPFLVSLYKQFRSRGLEIVYLSFEEEDQLKDPARLRAFIARYGIQYNVLLAGVPDQLNEKIPQGKNLNCWPTAFFLGRDGLVKEVHAGYAGPANPSANQALQHEVTTLIEDLLAEPAPIRTASLDQSR